MADGPNNTSKIYYRRIPRRKWIDEPHSTPQGAAFSINGEGMSVFSSHVASPLAVLEDQLNLWKAQAADEKSPRHEQAIKTLAKTPTVQEMVDDGWGIVALTKQQIERCGCTFGEEDPDTGHLDIKGNPARFDGYGALWANDCRVLSEQECVMECTPEWLEDFCAPPEKEL